MKKIFTTEKHRHPIEHKILPNGGVILLGVRFTKNQNKVVSKLITTSFFTGVIVGGLIIWTF